MLPGRLNSRESLEGVGMPQLPISLSSNVNAVPARFVRELERINQASNPKHDQFEIVHFDLVITLNGLSDRGRLQLSGIINQKTGANRSNCMQADEWLADSITLSIVLFQKRHVVSFVRQVIEDVRLLFKMRISYTDSLYDACVAADLEHRKCSDSTTLTRTPSFSGTEYVTKGRLDATSPLCWLSTSPAALRASSSLSQADRPASLDDGVMSPGTALPIFVGASGKPKHTATG